MVGKANTYVRNKLMFHSFVLKIVFQYSLAAKQPH